MPQQTEYTCKQCPLNGHRTHQVKRTVRVAHRADIAAYWSREAASGAADHVIANVDDIDDVDELAVDDDVRPVNVVVESKADDVDAELERLSSLLTGLVILDDGTHPHTQTHSKLFSSRDDFQSAVPEIPTTFSQISASQALQGLQAVAQAHSLPLRPAAMHARENDKVLLQEMLERIRSAHKEIDIQRALDASPETIASLTGAVDVATSVVIEAGRLASSTSPPSDNGTRKSPRRKTRGVEDDQSLRALLQSVREEAAVLDSLIDVVGCLLPPSRDEVLYNAEHHFEDPIAKYSLVAQLSILLTIICHVVIGVSTNSADFILTFVNVIIQATMSLCSPGKRPSVTQEHVLKQLPTSLEAALRRFKIDPATTIYATCPSCHHTHPPTDNRLTGEVSYPEMCQGYIYPDRGPRTACGTRLLELRQGKLRPIKPYVFTSFVDYIAAMLSDAEIERMCEAACDNALAAVREALSKDPNAPISQERVNNVFEAEFLRSFKGPVPDKLFIQRDGRLRLAFEVMLDFFNPDGTRKRGNHNSIGILAVVNLNLSEDIRYRPEFMWLSIIVGAKEPNHDEIDNYFRPLIDKFVLGWERGFRISRTALHQSGRSVDIAFVINVNDLPATRKAQGLAAANSHKYCSICDCNGVETMYNTDFETWKRRDIATLRAQAYAWRDALSKAARDKIFAKYGVRWSEFWRLPYWDPTRMAVVDAMHCILEGLVHHHCRRVLRIDTKLAKRKESMGVAFEQDWLEYDVETCHPLSRLQNEKRELPMIPKIQAILVQPLLDEDDDGDADDDGANDDDDAVMADAPDPRFVPAITELDLQAQLMKCNLQPLRWVVFSLGLDMRPERIFSKKLCCQALLAWRRTKPSTSGMYIPRSINLASIHFIQRVIAQTVTPAWVDSVPHNYGDSNAGTIKAGEWRILATIYLPIALILLWGDHDEQSPRLLQMLDHSMALFTAAILVCRYTMTFDRATKYRTFFKHWVDGLAEVHPHTRSHAKRPNVHMAFHIYDFLILFGPVISWWTFPFERVIGFLERINTNSHIGGELEATLSRSFMRGASIRRWLRRPNCPPVFKELKALFDKTFPAYNAPSDSLPLAADGERAHYKRNGINFSRASTHQGNSLVLYYPRDSREAIPGSIERILSVGQDVRFEIRRQAPLGQGMRDPFSRYRPFFPAQTYSSSMSSIVDTVPVDDVLSHYARFNFSGGRCVVLNLSNS